MKHTLRLLSAGDLSSDLLWIPNVTQLFCSLCGADAINGRLLEVEKEVQLSLVPPSLFVKVLLDA